MCARCCAGLRTLWLCITIQEGTERIREEAELLGVLFCDHIIIARDGYFSFSEEKKRELKEFSDHLKGNANE